MKIAVFTDTFFPTVNGIVSSTMSFTQRFADRGHKIIIFCPDDKLLKNYKYKGIKVVGLRGFSAFFYPEFKFTFFTSWKILREFNKFKPDIIHFHTQFVIGFKGLILGKFKHIPIVGTYHTKIADKDYLKVVGLDKFKSVEKIMRKYNNFFYDRCDVILTPTQDAKNELMNKGIKNENIVVVENPVPILEKPIIKYKYLDKIKEDIILYVGRISKEKSLGIALQAFKLALRKRKNVKFVIVGGGPFLEGIQKLVDKMGLKDNVIFLGKIPHEQLMNSDIYVKPKLFLTASTSETQGMTILEANYFGMPAIGVKKGGIDEVIKHNETGYKTKPGDYKELSKYILQILENPKLRGELSKQAKKFAKKFNIDILLSKLEKIYDSLIANYDL